MSQGEGFKRKCFVIDREFQFQYLMTWLAMTMLLLTGLVLASLTMVFVLKIRGMSLLVLGNGVSAIALAMVSMWFMVRHSHRIAGPAFRLERTIREMAQGKPTEHLRLRRKDYLKGIAAAVNEFWDKERERRAELSGKAERIEAAMSAGRACQAEVKELVQALKANPADLREAEGPAEELEAVETGR